MIALGMLPARGVGTRIPGKHTSEESFSGCEVSNVEMTGAQTPDEITVYTLPWCAHCARAKRLLRRRGIAFQEVDGSGVADFRRGLAELTGGFNVPQTVIVGEPIGGADQLAALDRMGVLAAIATGEQFPITRELRRISPRSGRSMGRGAGPWAP